MHVKYALLHCSYSAPICVSDIVAVVVAAREVVWGCVNGRRVIDAVRWVVPLRDIVAPERTVVAFVADVAALRDVAARDVVVRLLDRGTIVCDAVRAVVVRAMPGVADVAVRDDIFCAILFDVELFSRFVAFSSRTAALAMPMQIAKIHAKDKNFFISD